MNPPPNRLPIWLDQHALLVGINGSGKSTRLGDTAKWRIDLVRQSRMARYKFIIIDTKPIEYGQDDDLGHYSYLGGTIFRDWRDFNFEDENMLLIYRPLPEFINAQDFTAFFAKCFGYRLRLANGKVAPYPFTIAIDELIDIFTNPRSRLTFIEPFTKILTQGRSSLQTLWIATQFPVYIDSSIKRNARCNFVFRLPDPKDRDLMAAVLGYRGVRRAIPWLHGFWYQNDHVPQTLSRPWLFSGISEEARSRWLPV